MSQPLPTGQSSTILRAHQLPMAPLSVLGPCWSLPKDLLVDRRLTEPSPVSPPTGLASAAIGKPTCHQCFQNFPSCSCNFPRVPERPLVVPNRYSKPCRA